MKEHPLIGLAYRQDVTHLGRVDALDVSQRHDGPLGWRKTVDGSEEAALRLASQQQGLDVT